MIKNNQINFKFQPTPIWNYDTKGIGINYITISPNGQDLILSLWNGQIHIISSRTGRLSYSLPLQKSDVVITSTKYHPSENHLLLSVSSEGNISIYNYINQTFLLSSKENNNSIYCCEYSPSGDVFYTAGKNGQINQYDAETFKLLLQYSKDSPFSNISHSSRIYSLKMSKQNPSLLFSGGWDNRVIMWDTRTNQGMMSFGGPNICGDSIDIKNNNLLTGSWREKNPLEIWDIRNNQCIKQGLWGRDDYCYIYSAKFAPDTDYIVAGGSESTSIKIFGENDLLNRERLGFFTGAVNSTITSNDGSYIFAASQNGICQGFVATHIKLN